MRRAHVALLLAALVQAACNVASTSHTAGSLVRDESPPRHSTTADYSLYELPTRWRDQHGDTLQLSALSGRVRIVAMIYTSCTVTCPLIVGDLKRIEAALSPARRADVGFVLVSLDPWRDTPKRLAEWAARTGLDAQRWTLLAGSDDAVRELAASLDIRYQPQPGGELAHTNGITVLDRTGRIVYRQMQLGDTDATVRTVQELLR